VADETGRAVFRAIADWAQLRREARRASRDLKDTRRSAQDLDDSLGDLDKSGDTAAKSFRKVGDSAKDSDKQVKGLLGSIQQWSRVKANATLGLDARKAKADIEQIKRDLAGLRVTKLQIDAEAARAKQELNEVQAELARLRTQPTSAKVDADIAAALARIDQLKAHIASLRDARLRVDADTAKARAQLAGLSRDADALGRKRITLRADVDSSKLRLLAVAIGAVMAAAALIGPVIGAIAGLAGGLFAVAAAAAPAVAGLLAAAVAAGALAQAAGVAAIALSGVGKAVKALQARQDAAGTSATSSAKQQQAAADRIAAAQRNVTRAIEQRNRTAIQGRQAVEAAERAVASAVESSSRRIAAAERAHADAVRDVERARADLNRELALAQERMEDLALAAEGGALDEEAATIRLQRAEQDLARVRRLGGSGLDLQEAELGVRQAEHNLKRIQESNADLAQEVKQAATAGVEGDEQVIAARERVAEATLAVQDREAELHQARVDSRAEIDDAERQLSQTIQQAAWANADAQTAVTDATRELAQAYRDAGAAADAGGAGKAADDFDKASPAAKRFAQFINDEVLPALRRIRDEVQARALPKFETAIRTLLPLTDLFASKLGDTGDVIGDLAIKGAQMMASGPWTADFGTIMDSNNRIIGTLGNAALVAMDGLRHLWVTAGPLTERLANLVLRGMETARAFLEAKRNTGELGAFMTRAGDVIEQLLRIIGDFLVALWNIGKAAAPAGQILLDSLEAVTQKFRDFTGSVEGQNKMKEWFLAVVPTVQELGRLFIDLLKVFGRLAADPDTARFIEQLRTQLLPALDRMITALGEDVVPLLISFMSHLADIITQLGGGALVGFLGTLSGIAAALALILSIPGLGEFVGFILMIAGAGAAIGVVAWALGGVITGVRLLVGGLQLLIGVLRLLGVAAMTNPILAIVGAIAIAALLIIYNWDTVKQWLTGFWDWIKGAAQGVWDFLTGLFSSPAPGERWGAFIDGLKGRLGEWVDWSKQKAGEFWDWLGRKTHEAGTSIATRTSQLRDELKASFQDAWDTARRIVAGAWDFITGTTADRAGIMRGILKSVGDAVGIDLVGAWDRGAGAIGRFIDSIQRKVESLVAMIERNIARAEAALSRLGQSVQSGLDRAARAVIPGYATGGLVGGRASEGDNQVIRATAGEWVVPRDVTRRFLPFLKAITFGGMRAATQIVQPQQARLIQDRLAGVPDLSELAGLQELMTSTRGASSTTIDNSDNSRGVNVVTNIYNPIAEPASDSVADRMRTLSLMGAFS
jgi:hypothetical protein